MNVQDVTNEDCIPDVDRMSADVDVVGRVVGGKLAVALLDVLGTDGVVYRLRRGCKHDARRHESTLIHTTRVNVTQEDIIQHYPM